MAACHAAQRARRTLLLEKNRKPGAKILISGGTRCNLTHATDARGIIAAFGAQGRFLHSALSLLGPQEVLELFHAEGVPTQIEQPLGKVFPASDRALDVLAALLRRLPASACTLAREEPLLQLQQHAHGFLLVTLKRTLSAQSVVLATGGKSYPGCGTTGDGYDWARSLGHTIVEPRPALVPLRTDAAWVLALKGITIPDVLVEIQPRHTLASEGAPRKTILASQRGSFLFAHFGLSGPAVLDVSRVVSAHPRPQDLAAVCDFLPAVKDEALAEQLAAQCVSAGRQQAATVLSAWLPARLAEALLAQASVPADRRAAELSKADRQRMLQAVKRCAIPLSGTLGFKKAEVTSGGVSLQEVDSRNMQSKLVPGLFLAGELLDLDGPIGGYNFQAAFSTGWLAGANA